MKPAADYNHVPDMGSLISAGVPGDRDCSLSETFGTVAVVYPVADVEQPSIAPMKPSA